MDWSPLYPAFVAEEESSATDGSKPRELVKNVEVADIGCGFGGLLMAMAPALPETLILGNRDKLSGKFSPLLTFEQDSKSE
jgi:tRNA (guanine-N7-)-methyltransferase